MTRKLKNIATQKFNPIYRDRFSCQNSTFASSPDIWGCFLLNNLILGLIVISYLATLQSGRVVAFFGFSSETDDNSEGAPKLFGLNNKPCIYERTDKSFNFIYKFNIGLINTLYIHREPYSKNKGLLASITHTKNEALSDDLTTSTLQVGNLYLVSVAMSKLRYQTDRLCPIGSRG